MSVTDCFAGSSIFKVLEVKIQIFIQNKLRNYMLLIIFLLLLLYAYFKILHPGFPKHGNLQFYHTVHIHISWQYMLWKYSATQSILIFRNPWEKNYKAKLFWDCQPFLLSRLKMFTGDMMGDGICSCSVNFSENASSLLNIFHVGQKKGKFLGARL